MDWSDWKITPFQFVMYNVVPGNLDQHGTHPRWLHALVNLPILFGPLGICALLSALNYIAEVIMNDWKKKPSVRTVYAMTQFTFIVALALLSVFPHQEPRFLIPLTVPIGNQFHDIFEHQFYLSKNLENAREIFDDFFCRKFKFFFLYSVDECSQIALEMWKYQTIFGTLVHFQHFGNVIFRLSSSRWSDSNGQVHRSRSTIE